MIDKHIDRVLRDFTKTLERVSAKYISNDPEKLLRQFEKNYDTLDVRALASISKALPGMEEKIARIMARKEMQLDS